MSWKIDKRGSAGEKLKNLDNGKGEIFTDPNDIGIYMLAGDLDRKAEVKAVYREENGNLWVTYDSQARDPHTWYFPVVQVKRVRIETEVGSGSPIDVSKSLGAYEYAASSVCNMDKRYNADRDAPPCVNPIRRMVRVNGVKYVSWTVDNPIWCRVYEE